MNSRGDVPILGGGDMILRSRSSRAEGEDTSIRTS